MADRMARPIMAYNWGGGIGRGVVGRGGRGKKREEEQEGGGGVGGGGVKCHC